MSYVSVIPSTISKSVDVLILWMSLRSNVKFAAGPLLPFPHGSVVILARVLPSRSLR